VATPFADTTSLSPGCASGGPKPAAGVLRPGGVLKPRRLWPLAAVVPAARAWFVRRPAGCIQSGHHVQTASPSAAQCRRGAADAPRQPSRLGSTPPGPTRRRRSLGQSRCRNRRSAPPHRPHMWRSFVQPRLVRRLPLIRSLGVERQRRARPLPTTEGAPPPRHPFRVAMSRRIPARPRRLFPALARRRALALL